MTARRQLAFCTLCTALIVALFVTTSAAAGIGAGVRAGVSGTPDQLVVGGQLLLGSVAPKVQLVPGVDLGFGDDISTTAVNVDFRLNLPSLPKVSPSIYVGGGPTLISFKPDGGERDTKIGLSAFAGLKIPMTPISHYSLEARLGFGDVPELKVLFGIIWGL